MIVTFQMTPIQNFITHYKLSDFTTVTDAILLESFFFTGLSIVTGLGREKGLLTACGEFTGLLKNLISEDKQEDFPWILVSHELNVISGMLVEAIDDVLSAHTINWYSVPPDVKTPHFMILDVDYEI